MLHVYIDGVADARQPDQPLPPAGYGVLVVETTPAGDRPIFALGGPVTAATPRLP